MITAREPKQEDGTEIKLVDSRRGMKLVPGGRKVSKPLRIAISNNVFSSSVAKPVGGVDHSESDERPGANHPTTRAGGSRALVLALAVTASGLILNYLVHGRRKP